MFLQTMLGLQPHGDANELELLSPDLLERLNRAVEGLASNEELMRRAQEPRGWFSGRSLVQTKTMWRKRDIAG